MAFRKLTRNDVQLGQDVYWYADGRLPIMRIVEMGPGGEVAPNEVMIAWLDDHNAPHTTCVPVNCLFIREPTNGS